MTAIGVPPKLVRRLLLAPLVTLLDLAILLLSPLLALLGALASPLTGGAWRPLRIVAILVSWAACHLQGMLACLGAWLLGGVRRGAAARHSYDAILRRYVAAVNRATMRAARIDVHVCDSKPAEDALARGERPVVVLSRHAGEGDSLLILHALLCRYGRRPRVVLHEALRLDPLLDVLGDRLAFRFIDPRGGDVEAGIAAMASTLAGDGAVLIFPEGGNFSAQRRRRAIKRLERGGHDEEAAKARDMEHVAAPRTGGALTALEAAPDADAVFVGHVGIPVGIANLWRQLLAPCTVRLRMWHAAAQDIPADRDEQIEWLFACWARLDAWVDEQAG